MGVVYEADHLSIQRRVAIKVLHERASAESVARFRQEATAAGRIGSRHIVDVLDLGALPDGTPFMVMECLDGETLRQRLRRVGRMGPLELLPVVRQVLTALEAAHLAGIIHRDLKPENVFLVGRPPHEFVKLLDFGISKFQSGDGGERRLTEAGTFIGTLPYTSPEQVLHPETLDARSDLYSLGVILYECLSGQCPFSAELPPAPGARMPRGTVPELRSLVRDLDVRWADFVWKAMAYRPEARYQSAAEFRSALDRLSVPPTVKMGEGQGAGGVPRGAAGPGPGRECGPGGTARLRDAGSTVPVAQDPVGAGAAGAAEGATIPTLPVAFGLTDAPSGLLRGAATGRAPASTRQEPQEALPTRTARGPAASAALGAAGAVGGPLRERGSRESRPLPGRRRKLGVGTVALLTGAVLLGAILTTLGVTYHRRSPALPLSATPSSSLSARPSAAASGTRELPPAKPGLGIR